MTPEQIEELNHEAGLLGKQLKDILCQAVLCLAVKDDVGFQNEINKFEKASVIIKTGLESTMRRVKEMEY